MGLSKKLASFIKNINYQLESLVEDHFVDKNGRLVYAPTLNRTYKAKNILIKFEAVLEKVKGISYSKIETQKSSTNIENHLSKIKKLTNIRKRIRLVLINSCNS